MSLNNWYSKREILITGVTSELGRALLEKLLRSLPDVKIYAILRSRNSLNKDDRIKSIFASPGFQRLRQEEPDAINRAKAVEGNLLYEGLGVSDEDNEILKNVEIAFHAAGPRDDALEYFQQLPRLRAVVAAASIFKVKGQITEVLRNEKLPEIPLVILRIPFLGPAYKEPIPGYSEILRGPTALMIGAGYAIGRSELPAEVAPIDLVVNAFIVAAWEKCTGIRMEKATVYNVPILGCTWGNLIERGSLANRKFSYPTFGLRGVTSSRTLHWIIVLLLAWIPSALCDSILSIFGAKSRCVEEHEKIGKALRSLEPIASTSWPVERNQIYKLHERLSLQDRDTYPVCAEIDIESYVLCAAGTTRKYCVNEVNVKIVKSFNRIFFVLVVTFVLYYIFK